VYGSLYPFSGWVEGSAPFDFLFDGTKWTHRPSLGDVVTNLLAYAPFGFFAFRYWYSTHSVNVSAALAILVSAALSLGVEVLQGYLPTRVQSSVDLLLNVVSSTSGVALARFPVGQGRLPDLFRRLSAQWFLPGRLTNTALLAIAAWIASQLLPFVPSLDVGKFRAALVPLERVIAEPATFNAWHALAETLLRTGMGVILLSVMRQDKPAFSAFATLLAVLLLAQIPIIGRQLLPEVLLASLASLLLILALKGRKLDTRASWSFFLVFSGFCISQALGSSAGDLRPFNWIPFASGLENPVVGIGELTYTIGLAAALTWSVRMATASIHLRWLGWGTGAMVAGAALALEFNQSYIAGRTGDITSPMLLAIAWAVGWRYSSRVPVSGHQADRRGDSNRTHPKRASTDRKHPPFWRPRFELLIVAAAGVGIGIGSQLPFVPYNVRELIYAGHPLRSSVLLSATLYMTLAVPAWLAAMGRLRPSAFVALPLALLLNATVSWFMVQNAVPSESIHDIVGSPVLRWPGHIEVAFRFIALHFSFTLIVSGSVLLAMQAFVPQSWKLAGGWLFVFAVVSPALYWAIITQAATDNLTELMQGGGTPAAAAFLAMAGLLGFLPGCLSAAAAAFVRRRSLALILALLAAIAASAFLLIGTESSISKQGQQFSALQFLLSADRRHYAGPAELATRYALAYLVLTAVIAAFQLGAWRFLALRQPGLGAHGSRTSTSMDSAAQEPR
jgi:VanZ family protein